MANDVVLSSIVALFPPVADSDAATLGGWAGVVALVFGGLWAALDKMSTNRMRMTVAHHEDKIAFLQKHNEMCETKVHSLELNITSLMTGRERRAANRFSVCARLGDEIIADVSDGVKDVLGWRPAELVGRHVNVIIPDRIHAQHHAGVERAKATGALRPTVTGIITVATAKDGREVAVMVRLRRTTESKGVTDMVRADVFVMDDDAD